MTENAAKNIQKPSNLTKNELKTDIDEKKLTSKTDIDGGKLTSKSDFPPLFIKIVYDVYSVKKTIRILLGFVVTIGGVEYCAEG